MIATVAVGTDGSATADKAVEAALELAARYEAKIVFISAYKPLDDVQIRREQRDAPVRHLHTINPTTEVDHILRDAEERADARGLKWASEASEGDPADVVCELAVRHGADVIVVGSQGMQRKLLGSIPNSISHKAECAVFIVKTD